MTLGGSTGRLINYLLAGHSVLAPTTAAAAASWSEIACDVGPSHPHSRLLVPPTPAPNQSHHNTNTAPFRKNGVA